MFPDAAVADGTSAEFNYQYSWAGDLEPVRRYMLDSSFTAPTRSSTTRS